MFNAEALLDALVSAGSQAAAQAGQQGGLGSVLGGLAEQVQRSGGLGGLAGQILTQATQGLGEAARQTGAQQGADDALGRVTGGLTAGDLLAQAKGALDSNPALATAVLGGLGALAVGTGGAMVKAGGDSWYFLTVDYAFGHALEKDTADIVKASGGKVLGAVRIPLNTSDYSSFLLQAQSSKAKVLGLANAGADTINSIKQAAEFGIVAGGQKLAALLLTASEVHGLGLKAAQGTVLTESFYWDLNDKTRAFGERFYKRTGRMPSMIQAGTYSATLSYLKAIKAAGTKDSEAVVKKLKELPVDDAFTTGGKVQANGRMVTDLFLFEVKKPEESKRPWDYYKLLAKVPGNTAYPTAQESGCPFTK